MEGGYQGRKEIVCGLRLLLALLAFLFQACLGEAGGRGDWKHLWTSWNQSVLQQRKPLLLPRAAAEAAIHREGALWG